MTEVASGATTQQAAEAQLADGAGRRIARGLGANIGGMGVTLVIQLASVPVLLAAWGVSTYGEWLVLSAVPTFLALSDLSVSSVAGNSMVMLEAKGRRAEVVVLGRRLWSVVTVITGTAVAAAVAIALLFGGALGKGAAIPAAEGRTVLAALFLQVAVANQYGVLDAWYRAGGRYPLGATLRQLGRLFEFGALVGAVLLGARPDIAAVSFLAGSIAGFAVSWIALRRAVPWSTFHPQRPDVRTLRELLPSGVAFMAFPIGNALSRQGLTILIGSTLGAPAVVVFSTTRTLTRVALLAMDSINSSIWPELSRSAGGAHLDEARTILRRSVQVSLVGCLTLVLGLALFGVRVIRWWTGGSVEPPILLLLILLGVIIANSTWFTLSTVLAATNRHGRFAAVYLLGTVVALLGAVPLTSAFGLSGAAMSLLAIDLAVVAYVGPSSLRLVEDTPAEFLRALLDIPGGVRWAVSSMRSPT